MGGREVIKSVCRGRRGAPFIGEERAAPRGVHQPKEEFLSFSSWW
jgi:hypothetical protein